jgi:hypothetical protein
MWIELQRLSAFVCDRSALASETAVTGSDSTLTNWNHVFESGALSEAEKQDIPSKLRIPRKNQGAKIHEKGVFTLRHQTQ